MSFKKVIKKIIFSFLYLSASLVLSDFWNKNKTDIIYMNRD